jgi:nitrate reductase / nitrite oxidoreductase, alpha subunit
VRLSHARPTSIAVVPRGPPVSAPDGGVDRRGVDRRGATHSRPGLDGPVTDALLRAGRFFQRGEVSPDSRAVYKVGGREGDAFYRDRWSHDKVVRSTHGVNCTGSCSWKVYVKGVRA